MKNPQCVWRTGCSAPDQCRLEGRCTRSNPEDRERDLELRTSNSQVYAWLGYWRDKMPADAVTQLQDILGPLRAAHEPPDEPVAEIHSGALRWLVDDEHPARTCGQADLFLRASQPPPAAPAEREDMENIGRAFMEEIARNLPGYSWNDCPSEVIVDLINQRDDALASQPPRACLCDESLSLLRRMRAEYMARGDLSGRIMREADGLIERLSNRASQPPPEPHVIKQIEHGIADCPASITRQLADYIRGCIADYRHSLTKSEGEPLREIESLMDAKPGTPEGARLDALVDEQERSEADWLSRPAGGGVAEQPTPVGEASIAPQPTCAKCGATVRVLEVEANGWIRLEQHKCTAGEKEARRCHQCNAALPDHWSFSICPGCQAGQAGIAGEKPATLPNGARVRFKTKVGALPQDGWTIAKQPFDAASLYVLKHDSGGELSMFAEDLERLAVETTVPPICGFCRIKPCICA